MSPLWCGPLPVAELTTGPVSSAGVPWMRPAARRDKDKTRAEICPDGLPAHLLGHAEHYHVPGRRIPSIVCSVVAPRVGLYRTFRRSAVLRSHSSRPPCGPALPRPAFSLPTPSRTSCRRLSGFSVGSTGFQRPQHQSTFPRRTRTRLHSLRVRGRFHGAYTCELADDHVGARLVTFRSTSGTRHARPKSNCQHL